MRLISFYLELLEFSKGNSTFGIHGTKLQSEKGQLYYNLYIGLFFFRFVFKFIIFN
jgi:hypothetical protein